jgi:hypothetical protein
MSKSISRTPGRIGPLTYTPPKELGSGKEIPSWGVGGFGFDRGRQSGGTAPEIAGASGVCHPLSYGTARAVADFIDRMFATNRSRSGGVTSAREWVEAIIADLPIALDEAIQTADKRTNELRLMRAAATGDHTA